MYKDAVQYVAACPQCQSSKSSTQAPAGLAQQIEIPRFPWEHISLDLVTSLPRTKAGYDAAVVFVDRFSKMVHVAPTTSTCTGSDVAVLYLDNVVKHHGLAQSIISDRDPRWTGSVWNSLHRLLGTSLKMSTAYHPQTDGQSERAIKTITEMLRSYVIGEESSWDKYLPMMEFAYNSSVNPSSGFTPFFLVYGREMASPMAQLSEALLQRPNNMTVEALLTQWRDALRQARENLTKAQKRQADSHDQHRRSVSFAVGDRVMLSTGNLQLRAPRKLKPRWIGPFTVLEKLGEVNYRLLLPPELKRLHNVFHVSHLKAWKDDGRQPVVRPGPWLMGDEHEYDVEAILNDRLIDPGKPRKGKEYLIKWAGYPLSDATWEPEANLREDIPELLQAYQRGQYVRSGRVVEQPTQVQPAPGPLRRSKRLQQQQQQ